MSYQEAMSSWTDDLPVCRQSGIGFVSNEKYRMDGRRTEMHPNEDRYFHFRYDNFWLIFSRGKINF